MSLDINVRSRDDSRELFLAVFRDILERIGSPRCIYIESLIASRDYGTLCDLTCDPSLYTNAVSFRDDYLVTEMAKKFPDYPGFQPQKTAEEKDRSAELKCKVSNELLSDTRLAHMSDATRAVLFRARRIIQRTLGRFDLDAMYSLSRHGPGASTTVRGNDTSAYKKFSNTTPSMTSGAIPYYEAMLRSDWVYASHVLNCDVAGDFQKLGGFDPCASNQLSFVPKSSKTHRSICVEPDMNIFFQLGIGALIRRRLLRLGVNLDHQATVNQRLARLGSIDSSLSTIDLSAASDTICYELVYQLIPEDWFFHMANLRCPLTRLPDGTYRRNEKFSSMGNGYTFELESLIFLALTLGACGYLGLSTDNVSIFGDDIIVPSGASALLLDTLRDLGFDQNPKKTFTSGVFRESCGCDFFLGTNVRPFFVKDDLRTHVRVYTLANAIRRYSSAGGLFCDGRFRPAWERLVHTLPRNVPRIPDGYGDAGLVDEFDSVMPTPKRSNHGLEGFYAKSVVFRPFKRVAQGLPALTSSLRSLGSLPDGVYALRERGSYRVRKSLFKNWDSFGPWLN